MRTDASFGISWVIPRELVASVAIWTVACCWFPAVAAAQKMDFNAATTKVEGRFEPSEARPGQVVSFKVTVELKEGFYTYAINQPDPKAQSSATRLILPTPGDVIFLGPVADPPDFQIKSSPPEVDSVRIYPGGATWEIKALVSPAAKSGTRKVSLKEFKLIVCYHLGEREGCLPPKSIPISGEITILDGPPVAIDLKYQQAAQNALDMGSTELSSLLKPEPLPRQMLSDTSHSLSPTNRVEESKTVSFPIRADRDYAADMKTVEDWIPKHEASNAGFVAFIVAAFFWGAVTLMTPCVFPMVPITVSFFLKQGEKKQHNALKMAAIYTLTILLVLGLSARFAVGFFRNLSTHPSMNVGLGILFVVFATSLFGMFDMVLPSFLVRFTSNREQKGGAVGVVFMALSFSIVSFTCVAPFLGGFSGMAASGNFSEVQLIAGALAFAAAFAAPFFVLALFPSLIKKLPKSGGWMNTIKVVMGFLELAAALKFFRTAELRWQIPPTLFTYDLVLSIWIALLFICGTYLLNLYRLPHDEPQDHIGVPRMLFGILAISVGLYLLPGVFPAGKDGRHRPAGTLYAWVDAFLLPEPSAAEMAGGNNELTWSANLKQSIEEARSSDHYVFVDFTGVTCTNCKLNEKEVFTRPQVREALKKFRLVQLYTDTIPAEFYTSTPVLAKQDADAKTNLAFQLNRFGTEQLPLYVVLKPEAGSTAVRVVAIYEEGKINDDRAFVEMLQTSLQK